jgi:predicted DCC family thiol-disulfide oxidoreductase YuxK
MSSAESPLLLYDGQCALCNGWVRFLLRVDRGGSIRFAPLQGVTGAAVRARHPSVEGVDSIILVEREGGQERVSLRSTAVLRILRYLGWPWKAGLVGYVLPREIRDSLYDVVAWWRYRLFGRYDACPVPPAWARQRFEP